eukprot:TRINITY_DN8099_c0_g1_i1.p1 TRINITY_DN8099_c0_g1~~TRINITY_DN8099_c0_g1_i1.p1  ORF type:complete len:173 (-),score=37.02 TRINITY_DN8099_c0_g1_i1:3-500(-)
MALIVPARDISKVLGNVHVGLQLDETATLYVQRWLEAQAQTLVDGVARFSPGSAEEVVPLLRQIFGGEIGLHASGEAAKAIARQRTDFAFGEVSEYLGATELKNLRGKGPQIAHLTAAVLEYLCAEALELGGAKAQAANLPLNEQHIRDAIKEDGELARLRQPKD